MKNTFDKELPFYLDALNSYLRQLDPTYDINPALAEDKDLLVQINKLFVARFDPKNHDVQTEEELYAALLSKSQKLAQPSSARVSLLLQLIKATARTNAFLDKPYVSFKIASNKLADFLPQPIPYSEMYVYGDKFEGIHLKGGPVCRGGIRWSDRPQDYRKELLALLKAQNTKNSIIVPVGAKGAFVVRSDNGESLPIEDAAECYKNYLRAMLDLTDNIVEGEIVQRSDMVIHDQQDPYLVVAADKGTASFSDYANEISREYKYWLDDAFASGGSNGYDHKKLAITSKGAWVCFVEHLQNKGLELSNMRFLGIGDMSGDVFGNGMLLSKNIRLVAAFDHRHIFIDPNPTNLEASFNERKRLFVTPRSCWNDYDKSLISEGGGVFSKKETSITLSPQIQRLLQISDLSLSPSELIKALFKSDIEVIWNGGIGTYIKASSESNQSISDPANDAVRIDAKDAGAKIIVEGGNLGVSQKGRVEFALKGGCINADFIDNAGGVNCSDHEVNIKITLGLLLKAGIISRQERNKLIADMQAQVAMDVVDANRSQTIGITVAQHLFDHASFMDNVHYLQNQGILNPALEFLPNENEVEGRKLEGKGLTRPEIAVLLSYNKRYLGKKLIALGMVEDDYLDRYLLGYFPDELKKDFCAVVLAHPLKVEITATMVANRIIDRLGARFIVLSKGVQNLAVLVKAFCAVELAYNIDYMWGQISLSADLSAQERVEDFLDLVAIMTKQIEFVAHAYDCSQYSIQELAVFLRENSPELAVPHTQVYP